MTPRSPSLPRPSPLTARTPVAHIVGEIRDKAKLLESVRLNGDTWGIGAMEAVLDALMECSCLRVVDMADCFTRRKEEEIFSALERIGALVASKGCEALNLSDNALSLRGAVTLRPFLRQCRSLKELRLHNTGVGPLGGINIGRALHEGAHAGMRLRVLQLGRSRLENRGAAAIADAIAAMASLQSVQLVQNGIKQAGIEALAAALACNPGLTHLDLQDNVIGPAGAEAVARLLLQLDGLEHINFGDCLIKRGIGCIAAALAGRHPQLKHIDLTFNELRAAEAEHIAACLQGKGALTAVELDGNSFDQGGIALIAAALADGDALGSVDEMYSEDEDEEDEDDEDEDDEDEDEDEAGSDEELCAPLCLSRPATPNAADASMASLLSPATAAGLQSDAKALMSAVTDKTTANFAEAAAEAERARQMAEVAEQLVRAAAAKEADDAAEAEQVRRVQADRMREVGVELERAAAAKEADGAAEVERAQRVQADRMREVGVQLERAAAAKRADDAADVEQAQRVQAERMRRVSAQIAQQENEGDLDAAIAAFGEAPAPQTPKAKAMPFAAIRRRMVRALGVFSQNQAQQPDSPFTKGRRVHDYVNDVESMLGV